MNSPDSQRLVPLDWMRGLVMMFMALDHVSAIFNLDRVSEDSYASGAAGAALFTESGASFDFFTRWITHLCAPTFVFLAGTALALSVAKRLERGDSPWAIDRHLLARGVILIALEAWMSLGGLFPVLEVLYAIGASLLCMVLLRRLPSWALVGLALLWMGAGEWITGAAGLQPEPVPGGFPLVSAWSGLVLVPGLVHTPVVLPAFLWMPQTDVFISIYPFLPWLVIMMLGWAFGRWLVARRESEDLARSASRLLAVSGAGALGLFLVQRIVDGYGNFWLPRGSDFALRWLQVSKYPPSLAFYGLELGLMALVLSGFFRWQRPEVNRNGPLLVFGQVALFFFVIHIHLMMLVRVLGFGLDEEKPFQVTGTWVGTVIALVVLYPICRRYRSIKQTRPAGVLRFF
ncbi:MAG: DUF1624 domain-containing protein [bacterium]|nr:DUF1624 domain-containing protein [bacterium]